MLKNRLTLQQIHETAYIISRVRLPLSIIFEAVAINVILPHQNP